MTEFLHSIAEGSTSTYPSLKPSDIEKIEFQLPPNERLDEFEQIVSNFFKKINSNQTQIRTLTTLRDTLLPKLMSGEIRVEPLGGDTFVTETITSPSPSPSGAKPI